MIVKGASFQSRDERTSVTRFAFVVKTISRWRPHGVHDLYEPHLNAAGRASRVGRMILGLKLLVGYRHLAHAQSSDGV